MYSKGHMPEGHIRPFFLVFFVLCVAGGALLAHYFPLSH
jgi:hypothetical protein